MGSLLEIIAALGILAGGIFIIVNYFSNLKSSIIEDKLSESLKESKRRSDESTVRATVARESFLERYRRYKQSDKK